MEYITAFENSKEESIELSEKEKLLIKAVRELNEVPYNVLLWYIAGLEGTLGDMGDKVGTRAEDRRHKIDIARSYMKDM